MRNDTFWNVIEDDNQEAKKKTAQQMKAWSTMASSPEGRQVLVDILTCTGFATLTDAGSHVNTQSFNTGKHAVGNYIVRQLSRFHPEAVSKILEEIFNEPNV